MIILIVCLALAYLGGVAATIAIAGHLYGPYRQYMENHSKYDLGAAGYKKWNDSKARANAYLTLAWVSPLWPPMLAIAIPVLIVGGAVWGAWLGSSKLFRSQAKQAMRVSDRKQLLSES